MKATILIVVMAAGLVAAGAIALNLWLDLEGVSLGFHGWLALGLGVLLSLAVGIGLMTLVFLSSRRGYDDDAGGAPDAGAVPDPGRPEDEPPRRGSDDAQR